MTNLSKSDRDLRTFMQIAADVAIAEAKLMPTTPDIQRRAAALVQFGRDKLAELRRSDLASRPTNVVSGTIRGWIAKLTRSEASARLNQRSLEYPELCIAHREFETMTDDDIKSALEDVESLLERAV